MKDIHEDCVYRIAADGPPENPLQSITSAICRSSMDFSLNKFDAYLYAICVGWDDEVYEVLKIKHKWPDETVEYLKRLHQNYITAWNLLTENNIK